MFDDDNRPKRRAAAVPGEDLSLLSISDLEERIALYRGEIERLEADIAAKRASRDAADAVFRR